MVKTLTGRPVGRPREFDEEAVLEAAMDAFWRKGYEATSLVDLTEATGLNKASLYRVFGDKHQLFKTTLKHYADREFRETTSVVREDASPLENIRAVVKKITTDFEHEKGCMITNSMVELAPHDDEIGQMLQEFGEKRVQALTGVLTMAQQAGEVRKELVPMELAASLMITLAGSAAMVKGFMNDKQIIKNLENLINSWT